MPRFFPFIAFSSILIVNLYMCTLTYAAEVYGKDIVWNPGIEGGIPDRPVCANVLDFGAKGDGVTNNFEAFSKAIESVTDGGAIIIPEGDYLVKSGFSINKPVVFRGEGPDKTRLLIDHSSNAFEIITYKRGTWTKLTGGFEKGSKELIVSDATGFAPGRYIEIQQDNDPSIMYTMQNWKQSWADYAVGQIAKIVYVSGNTVTIDEPLRITYSSGLNPSARTQGLSEHNW